MAEPTVQDRLRKHAAKLVAALRTPSVQVAAAAGVGGATLLGAVGGAVGAAAGAAVGVAVGLPLALFTLGLSLPLGLVAGGGFGFLAGSAAGGGVGGLASSLVGYFAYSRRDQIRSSAQRASEQLALLVRPPKGNRAFDTKAAWFSGQTIDGFTVLAQRVVGVDRKAGTLGQQVGPTGDAVVIFLRHLGCAYCWSQVREWFAPEVVARTRALGLRGPLLVAPGTPEQLVRFLQSHPDVSPALAFVDPTPDFEAYRAVGFQHMRFGALPEAATLRPKAPLLGLRGLAQYAANMLALAPRAKRGSGLSEGVTLLGGTFALRGCGIVYAWADRMPSDYPSPAEVLDAVAQSALLPVAAAASHSHPSSPR